MTKPILAMMGGFVLAFGMFVGGMVFAIAFLVPGEPVRQMEAGDNTDLWAVVPRATDSGEPDGGSEIYPARVTARPAIPQPVPGPAGTFDVVETASVAVEPEIDDPITVKAPITVDDQEFASVPDDPAAKSLLQAHLDWCVSRYRSFQPVDNTYLPYAGGRRACFSPYISEFAARTGKPMPIDPHVRFVPLEPPVVAGPSDGIVDIRPDADEDETAESRVSFWDSSGARAGGKDCSDYRTYDPTDNTYQPYGGGPRRVCE